MSRSRRSGLGEELDPVAVWVFDDRDRDARPELDDRHGDLVSRRLTRVDDLLDVVDADRPIAVAERGVHPAGRCSRQLLRVMDELDQARAAVQAVHRSAARHLHRAVVLEAEHVAVERERSLRITHDDAEVDRVLRQMHTHPECLDRLLTQAGPDRFE